MKQTVINPKKRRDLFYFWAGLGILAVNCIRHRIQGYTTPRDFPVTEFERATRYDIAVAQHWMEYLEEYIGENASVEGKRILEIGPGEELGIGLLFLGRGAAKYNAIDAHYLLKNTPPDFYEVYFRIMKKEFPETNELQLRDELESFMEGSPKRLNYIYDPNFDLNVFGKDSIDLVFSNAAVEHIADPERTVKTLNELVVPGGIAIISIGFVTHTRWIMDVDPLNIYRYPDAIYKMFSFSGIPNRVRPYQYRQMFEAHGWEDIHILERTVLDKKYMNQVTPHLTKKFRALENEMHIVTGVLCAKKK